jgi:hypothetical protein
MALWDNFIYAQSVSSANGIQDIYFPSGTQSIGSEDIFSLDVQSPPGGTSYDQIVVPSLLVSGVYTFNLSVHWDGPSKSHLSYCYLIGGFDYPGQVGSAYLQTRRIRDMTLYNDWEFWDEVNFTVPISIASPSVLDTQIFWDALYNSETVTDDIYSRLWVTYHGPLNYVGSFVSV